jgi:hypothetical protein
VRKKIPPSIGGDLNIVAKGLNAFEKKLHPKWKAEIGNLSHNQWVDMLKTCYIMKPELGDCGNHKHVLKLRKILQGLVVGPLDKNGGQLWACCPCTYHTTTTMGTPLVEGESYKNTYIKPFNGIFLENEYKKTTKHKKGNMHSILTAIQNSISHSTQLGGDEKDLIKTWQWAYHKMGWQKLQHFNPQGHLSPGFITHI